MKRRHINISTSDSEGGYSSIDDELMIDMHPKKARNLKYNSSHSKRYKNKSEDTSNKGDLEKRLENLKMNNRLEYTAVKNNLTVANVRNLLKRVVSNEHVLAIVKLKESEEMEDKDGEDVDDNNAVDDNDDEDDDDDSPLHKIPTLTRSKAKELQGKDLPIVWPLPVSPVQPASSEVAVLINEELPEDSSDEEYQPHDEENSDDDKESTTTSDLDTLSNAPPTPTNAEDGRLEENNTCWTEDGLFKIPQTTANEEQNIALRTRSKLSLSSTHIETIEKAFIPPDITSDMYDCDDIDGVWKDFLNEFTEPLPQVQEDDEETDPEYYVQVDDIPVDKEELREDPDVTVSRRELSDLVAELFDSIVDNGAFNGHEQQNVICDNMEEKTNENDVTQDHVEEIDMCDQFEGTDIIITPAQRLILAQQLRQHIQLCTQNYLQLYGHPELWSLADTCKENLDHLLTLSDNNTNSAFMACNLKGAIDLCESWQKRLTKDNDDTRSIYKFITNEISKSRASKIGHNRYYSKFPPQLMDVICDSNVFIYPELLPKIPFRVDINNSGSSKDMSPAEEHVIAIELSLYYKYLEDNPKLYKKGKKREYSLQTVLRLIEKNFKNGRSVKTLTSQISARKNKTAKDNAIKYYFEHKVPPPTEHIILPFDPEKILPLRMQRKDNFPYIWREYVLDMPLEVINSEEQCLAQNNSAITSQSEKNRASSCKQADGNEVKKNVINEKVITSKVMTLKQSKNTSVLTTVSSSLTVSPNITTYPGGSYPVLYTSPTTSTTKLGFIPAPPELIYTNQIPMPLLTFISSPVKDVASLGVPVQNSASNLLINCLNVNTGNIGINQSDNNTDNVSIQCNSIPLASMSPSIINSPCVCKCVCKCSDSNKTSTKNQRLLTDYFKPAPKESENIRMNLPRSLNDNRNIAFKIIWKFKLHIHDIYHNVLNNLRLIYNVNYKQTCIKETFVHLLTLEFFLSLYFPKMLPSMPNLMTPNKQDIGVDTFQSSVQSIKFFEYSETTLLENSDNTEKDKDESDDNADDTDDIKKAKNRTPKTAFSERRKQKSLKESQIVKDMLSKPLDEDYDMNYAKSYYERVQDRLSGQDPSDFKKFVEIVESVSDGEDPSEVYKRLEILLMPNHPDLLDQFLTFLLPGQAAKIGKFMEHFLISNMENFVQKMNVYFAKQPSQMKKIYTALSELSDIPNVTMDDIKSSIMPLLKGNQLLVDWFLQLFPNEKPLESDISDFERLDFDKMDSADMSDHIIVPEENDDPYGGDNCICKCHNSEDDKYRTRYLHCIPCGMKYIQGRVYIQIGKRLRPATVTFDGPIPMSEHVKRLSAKPKPPYKRRAECSPTKLLLSPNKSSGSSSEEQRLDMSTDNEDDYRKSPKKTIRTTQSKFKDYLDSAKDCHVVIKVEECLDKKQVKTNDDDCNGSVPDSTEYLCSNGLIGSSSNNIQVNVCDSTEIDIDVTKYDDDKALQVMIPNDDLNISLESDEKISPTSSDASIGSESDVSIHSEKSENMTNTDSDNSSIDDIDENSNDSDDMSLDKNEDESDTSSLNDVSDEDLDVELVTKIDEPINVSDDDRNKNDDETDSKSWTREEDKIVLQTFQEECDFDSTLAKICELLPHKHLDDVKNRFKVLLNLLQKMSAQK